MEDPIWPKTPEKQNIGNFLQFQSNVISKWGGAAKIVSFLDKTNGAGLHYFCKIAVLPQPCCKEKWRIQYGQKVEKRVYFYTFKHRPSVNGGELPKVCLVLVKIELQDSTIFKMALLYSLAAMKNGGFNMADTTAACIFGSS